MDELLEALEKLYDKQNNSCINEGDGKTYFVNSDSINKVRSLCRKLLVTSAGLCNIDNIGILRKNGYRTFSGETDWFGWVTGCVQKRGDPRILVYDSRKKAMS